MTQAKLDRGVHNPRIIDLITRDEARGEVVLAMIEERPWDTHPEQLEQLNDKLDSYLSYALDGHLVEQYPQYAGYPVQLRLDCVSEPRGTTVDLLKAARQVAAQYGIRLLTRVLEAAEIERAPWETAPPDGRGGGDSK